MDQTPRWAAFSNYHAERPRTRGDVSCLSVNLPIPPIRRGTFLRGRALSRQFRNATRAGRDLQAEAVQFGDRAHQAQSKPQAGLAPTLVRTVEAPRHELAFTGGNPGPAITNAHDGLATLPKQTQLDPTALRCKLDGIVDKIGNRLEQKIAITVDRGVCFGSNIKIDIFVFRNRLIKVADLTHEFGKGHCAKSIYAAAVLDLGNAQQRRDYRKRLVESYERPIDASAQFIDVCSFVPGTFKRYPNACERRAQIVRDVVPYPFQTPDENFDLSQHPIHKLRQFVERFVGAVRRQPFSQLACHDALDLAVDFLNASLRANT